MSAFFDEAGHVVVFGFDGALEQLLRQLRPGERHDFEHHLLFSPTPPDSLRQRGPTCADDLERTMQELLGMTPAELDALHFGDIEVASQSQSCCIRSRSLLHSQPQKRI